MHQHFAIDLVRLYQEQLRADAASVRLRSKVSRVRPMPERLRSLAHRWRRRHVDPADDAGVTRRQPATLDDLAERVALGPRDVELELRQFIRYARARGATPLLLSVLADPTQPDVVRQRAFGEIHVELEHSRTTPSRTDIDDNDAA
jgi:hypothetical protein